MSSPIPEYFALFGLEPRFAIDAERLTRAYREVLSQVHPDRFASAGPAERRAAMQMSSHANEAYDVLRSDSARAAYLCARGGVPLDGPGAAPLPAAFLEQQMHWREVLAEARAEGDVPALARLAAEVATERATVLRQLAGALDERGDVGAGAASARALQFLDKLEEELARVRQAMASPAGTPR